MKMNKKTKGFISGFLEIVLEDGRSEITPFIKCWHQLVADKMFDNFNRLVYGQNQKFTMSLITDRKGIERIVKQNNDAIKKHGLANDLWDIKDYI